MQRIQNQIKEQNFRQINLLYGEEGYLKKQYAHRLRSALTKGDEMNTHFYEGKDVPVGEIIDLAETMPFLADRRVILLSDTGLFKSGGEKLAEYLCAPNSTTFFVFTESEVDKRSKLFKTVSSKGCAVEFTAPDETTLKQWIASVLAKEGKKITDRTAHLLLTKTGTDMQNIRMELEKLISYCMDRDVITDADVETVCTTRITDRIFDMMEAVARHQTDRALDLYYDLLALKIAPLHVLTMIARQYNHLLQTKEMKFRGIKDRDIASKLGVPPFAVGKYASQASLYKSSELKKALEACVDSDYRVKTGQLNDRMAVELLILSSRK